MHHRIIRHSRAIRRSLRRCADPRTMVSADRRPSSASSVPQQAKPDRAEVPDVLSPKSLPCRKYPCMSRPHPRPGSEIRLRQFAIHVPNLATHPQTRRVGAPRAARKSCVTAKLLRRLVHSGCRKIVTVSRCLSRRTRRSYPARRCDQAEAAACGQIDCCGGRCRDRDVRATAMTGRDASGIGTCSAPLLDANADDRSVLGRRNTRLVGVTRCTEVAESPIIVCRIGACQEPEQRLS